MSIYPSVDEVKEFSSFDISLSSQTNLDPSSLVVSLELSISEVVDGDYVTIDIPDQLIS